MGVNTQEHQVCILRTAPVSRLEPTASGLASTGCSELLCAGFEFLADSVVFDLLDIRLLHGYVLRGTRTDAALLVASILSLLFLRIMSCERFCGYVFWCCTRRHFWRCARLCPERPGTETCMHRVLVPCWAMRNLGGFDFVVCVQLGG